MCMNKLSKKSKSNFIFVSQKLFTKTKQNINQRNLDKNLEKHVQQMQKCKVKLKTQGSLENLLFENLQKIQNKNSLLENQSDVIQNHDDELKQYISGLKTFKQKNLAIQKFSKTEEIKRITHKKQKSKSQIIQQKPNEHKISQNLSQYSNRDLLNTTVVFQNKKKLKTEIQITSKNKRQFQNKKQIKYLNLDELRRNSTQKTVTDMQFLIKKITQKHKRNFEKLMRKVSLPRLALTQHKNIFNTKQKGSFISQYSKQNIINSKRSKDMTIDLSLELLKIKQRKMQELKRLESQIVLKKEISEKIPNQLVILNRGKSLNQLFQRA